MKFPLSPGLLNLAVSLIYKGRKNGLGPTFPFCYPLLHRDLKFDNEIGMEVVQNPFVFGLLGERRKIGEKVLWIYSVFVFLASAAPFPGG